ncbi:MAG: phosphotransferase [Pseudomonadota bacterium]
MATELSELQNKLVRSVCQDYRSWAPHLKEEPGVVMAPFQGLSNLTLRLEADGEAWALRLQQPDPPLGVDRRREQKIQQTAAKQGLAPQIVRSAPDFSYLLTEWIEPEKSIPENYRLECLATFLKRLHRLPPESCSQFRALDLPAHLDRYLRLLPRGAKTHASLDKVRLRMGDARALIDRQERYSVICHNDLNAGNVLLHQGRILALDWEYASLGNPYFDLAVASNQVESERHHDFLAQYLDRNPTRNECNTLKAYQLLSAVLELAWRELHAEPEAVDSASDRLAAIAADPC